MDILQRQIQRARRRLLLEKFIQQFAIWLFAALVVATIAIAIPKIWDIGLDSQTWITAWLGGALAIAGLMATVMTWITGARPLDAALEIDRRYGLKERLSSFLALKENELETPAGTALLEDAVHRVERIDVSEHFQFKGRWWNGLPLIPALLVFLIAVFIPDAAQVQQSSAKAAATANKARVTNSTDALKKKLAQRKQLAKEEGLPDAEKMFNELEQGVAKLRKNENLDQKKALVKLNDLAEQIKQRRESLGSGEKLKEHLNQLSKLKQGPGEKFSRALKQGDLKKAMAELGKLQGKLQAGKLSEKEQQALGDQLKQMGDKLNEMLANRDQARDALKQEMEQAKRAGNLAKAGQLQDKLDKMASQDAQMQKLAKLAEKMSATSGSLSKQDLQKAASQLAEMGDSLSEMQATLEELELLDDAMEQLAGAKSSMACENCQGEGCSMCQGGMGNLAGMSRGSRGRGMGMGQGQGVGDRPEAETNKNFYDSQVRANGRNGRGVITGFTSGPNLAGNATEEIKLAIEAAGQADDDPLSGTRLPKHVRDHAQEYFDKFREGE